MYVLASQLLRLPIISLQTGETEASVKSIIIEMSKLEIVAIGCTAIKDFNEPIILVRDIRQLASDCLIVDSRDDISSAEDIVRIKDPLLLAYTPIGAHVISQMQRPIGKVEDYTINSESLKLQKLYVRQPIWRSWMGSSLIISREQILDVSAKQIVVREATEASKLSIPKQAHETQP